MKDFLFNTGKVFEKCTDLLAIVFLVVSILYSCLLVVSIPFIKKYRQKYRRAIESRIIIATGINLSLTLILASDIVKSIRSDSYVELGKLAIIIIIRQFVTYTLDREIIQLDTGKILPLMGDKKDAIVDKSLKKKKINGD